MHWAMHRCQSVLSVASSSASLQVVPMFLRSRPTLLMSIPLHTLHRKLFWIPADLSQPSQSSFFDEIF